MRLTRTQLRRIILEYIDLVSDDTVNLNESLVAAAKPFISPAATAIARLLAQYAPSTAASAAAASLAQIGLAGIAGYAVGDYIQDKMSGNSGTIEEKFLNSFKRHAKEAIGELGALGGLLPTWDTVSDEEFMKLSASKNFKGLTPRDVDPGRTRQLLTLMLVSRNFGDKKMPDEIMNMFKVGYLNSLAWMKLLNKKEAELVADLEKS